MSAKIYSFGCGELTHIARAVKVVEPFPQQLRLIVRTACGYSNELGGPAHNRGNAPITCPVCQHRGGSYQRSERRAA